MCRCAVKQLHSLIQGCLKSCVRRPRAADSWVVGDLPQLSELANCLLGDHVCVSSLEVVAPTHFHNPVVISSRRQPSDMVAETCEAP